MPVALVDLIEGELYPATVATEKPPRSRGRRLADTAILLLAIGCLGACAVAVAEHAVALSVAAVAAAMVTVAYRPIRVRSAHSSRLPSRGQPAPPSSGRN